MNIGTETGNVVAGLRDRTPSGSSLKSKTVSASIVSRAARGKSDARKCLLAPRLISRANTFTGNAVVVVFAGWDEITGFVCGAYGVARNECQAISAVIVGDAAGRDVDTSFSELAPSLSGIANAFSGLAIVIGRAVGRNLVASVGFRAPVESGQEACAGSAVVVSSAAGGNPDAGLRSGAPRLSLIRTQALPGYAVMACDTVLRNLIARGSLRTNSESRDQGEAIAAVVVSRAASRHLNALVLQRAPRESDIANTGTSYAIVIVRTGSGNVITGLRRGTPRSADLIARASSAIAPSQTAGRNGNTA